MKLNDLVDGASGWAPCPCGGAWEIERYDVWTRAYVEDQVRRLGEFVPITIGQRSWLVPRRHIAYHGVTGAQLLSGTSGFDEITEADARTLASGGAT